MKMRFFIFLAIILLFTDVVYSQTDTATINKVKSLSQQVKLKYVPDSRVKQWFAEPVALDNQLILKGYTTEPDALDAMVIALKEAGISAIYEIELLPSPNLGESQYGIVNVSVSNNRYEPRQSAEMATQMTMGTPVELLRKQGGYYLVRTPDTYISWTEDMMVAPKTKAELSQWNSSPKVVFTDYYGHAYAKNSTASAIVSDLVAGNILRLIKEEKKFFAVEYPDGRKGYVEKSKAMKYDQWLAGRNPNAENVVATARTMMGTPYLWGGTSIKAVDCSGFTKTAFFLNGVILPRDASQQVKVGERVDIYENDTVSIAKAIKNLQSGDLIFFSSLKDGKPTGKITHVAMYLHDGEFIHSSGLVRVNSMKKGSVNYSDWESRAFTEARRIVNHVNEKGIEAVSKHPLYNQRP